MKKKKLNITLGDIVPVISFFVILIFFTIASKGKMLSAFNIKIMVDQSIQTIILGCGLLFVVAQGSIDLSVGVNLALSAAIGNYVATVTGVGFLMIPATLIVGLIIGIFNGFIVSKCHVPSFMLSIAMLIGVRGIANYVLTTIGISYIPESMAILNANYIKFPAFVIIVLIVAYVFEFTQIGHYSRAIGENETTAKSIGIPVVKMKWLVFAISGLLAGVAALFCLASVGGTSMQMGSFMEMKTAMAIYFGGVLVTGGSSAKFYKIILGSLSITLIINGLTIIGMSASQISESVEGILLLLVLFITILINNRRIKAKDDEAPAEEKKVTTTQS